MAKIKSGDVVYVIAGDDRGMRGVVRRVDPKKNTLIVEGVHLCVRHTKPSVKNPEGGKITKETPIHISNVALANPGVEGQEVGTVSLTTRVGYRIGSGGEKVRYAKQTGNPV